MEDYEREAAEEWQEVGEQKNRRRRAFVAQIPKAELARADFEPDTQARTQWRQHERPTKITTLPKDFVPTDKGSRRGRTATRDDSPFDTIPELSKIAKDTATEVFQQVTYDARRRQPNLVVSIYGTEEAAQKAADLIERWVKSYVPEKPSRSAGWAKVNSVGTPEQRDRYLAKVREQEERDSYRRDPPTDVIFPAVGKFEWDAAYSSPADILGTRLEACDPLRTELTCFISPDKVQATAIKVHGNDHEKVKLVLNRLRGAFCQAISRDNASHTKAVYIFNPIPKPAQRSIIVYEPIRAPGASSTDDSDADGVRVSLAPADIDDEDLRRRTQRAQELPADNAKRLKKAMIKALTTAKYFRGNLRMRATFGVFLLKRYRRGVNDVEGFEDMMNEDGVDGNLDANSVYFRSNVVEELKGNPIVWKPQGDPPALPKPTYSAKFLLKHKHDVPDLKFEAEFDYDEEGSYPLSLAKRWSRFIHAPGLTVKLLDVCLVDLTSASDAWSIDIDATEWIPASRAPELAEFGEGVNLIHKLAKSVEANDEKTTGGSTKGRYFDFETVPGVVVHWLVQKKHWTFEYGKTGYLIDVAKAEEFRLRNPTSHMPEQRDLVQSDPMWRVSIYRKSWDVDLAENAHLPLGEGMRSNKTVADFFPASAEANAPTKSRSDVAHFLQILNEVRIMIRGGLVA